MLHHFHGPSPAIISAARILVAAGVANLLLSFLLGWVLSAKRMKEPMPKHHWLLVAHTVSLQEGVMLLGLSYAVHFAGESAPWLPLGAWLLAIGSLFQDLSGVINWLRRTDDQFAERSLGWISATINAILNTVGLIIVSVAIIGGLMT